MSLHCPQTRRISLRSELRLAVAQADGRLTPLRFFLQSSMLSTDTEVEDEEGNKPVGAAGSEFVLADQTEGDHLHRPFRQRP